MKTIAACAALGLACATKKPQQGRFFSDDDTDFVPGQTHFVDERAGHKKTSLRGAARKSTHVPHPPSNNFDEFEYRTPAKAHKVQTHQQKPHMQNHLSAELVENASVDEEIQEFLGMPVADLKFGDYFVSDAQKLNLQQKHKDSDVSAPSDLPQGFLSRSALAAVGRKECEMPIETLRIFVDADFRPLVRSNSYTSWGFDYELVDQACMHAGIQCSIVTDKWQNVWPGDHVKIGHGFLENHFDCASSTYNTPQRRTLMRFSDPYLQPLTASLVTRPGHCPAVCTADACQLQANETIGYVRGYAHDDSVGQRMFAGTSTGYNSISELRHGLLHGEVAFALVGPEVHAYGGFVKCAGSSRMVNPGGGFMCSNDKPQMAASLNRGLRMMKQNGKLAELCEKHKMQSMCDVDNVQFDSSMGGVECLDQAN